MFNLWELFKSLFNPTDDSLVGLRRLNEVKIEPEIVKSKVKKEIKISDLMKKTVTE